MQEEDVLGKAYDARLMKRLLTYLHSYRWQVTVALIAIIIKAGADVLGPYLTKSCHRQTNTWPRTPRRIPFSTVSSAPSR